MKGGHYGSSSGGLKLAEGIGKASRQGWGDQVSKKAKKSIREGKKKQRGKKKIEGKGKKKQRFS